MKLRLIFSLLLATLFSVPALAQTTCTTGTTPVHLTENFSSGSLQAWQMPHPEDWAIESEGSSHFLHMLRSRDPLVPRRPVQFALLKEPCMGTFDLRVRLRRTGKSHSVILVFDYIDSLHFYYTHLSVDTGTKIDVHNGIFIVNGEPRQRIAGMTAAAVLPDQQWHTIHLHRDAKSGLIQLFVDREAAPRFSVVDHTFACGRIGLGSFDETGDFADLRLDAPHSSCPKDR